MNNLPEHKYRKNYISTDGLTAMAGLGDFFEVGEATKHQSTGDEIATIISFEHDIKMNEVKVNTTKGYCYIDFLVKCKPVENE